MNKNRRIVVYVCLLAVAASLLIAVNARAAVVENVDIPITGALLNPCNGATLTYSGTLHAIVSITLNSAGGFHLDLHDNIHVTATDTLGNSYEGTEEDLDQFNGRFGVEQTVSTTFHATGKGSAPNFDLHSLLHITVNANGTLTTFVDHFTAVCRS